LGLDPNQNPSFFLGLANSEFNSIHFGVGKKNKNFLGLKYFEISLKFFFLKFRLVRVKHFGLGFGGFWAWVLGLGFGCGHKTQTQTQNPSFFWVKQIQNLILYIWCRKNKK